MHRKGLEIFHRNNFFFMICNKALDEKLVLKIYRKENLLALLLNMIECKVHRGIVHFSN